MKIMDALYDKVLDISHNHYKYLLSLENVNGIGLGFKQVNGINTKEPCIHVLLENKVDSNLLLKNNIIPKSYMGIKTDVIKAKMPKIRNGPQDDFIKDKLRPLESGCGITSNKPMNGFYGDGTLGCILTKYIAGERQFFLLSNAHVLSDSNDTPIGTEIIQPPYVHSGRAPKDTIAHLTTYVPIEFETVDSRPINYIDAGIAKLTKNSLATNRIYDLGEIKGVDKPSLGIGIQKVGFVTGLSFGEIKTVGVSTPVEWPDTSRAFFKDLILSDNLENDDGDSRSVVLNDDNKVVGLFMAGVDSYAYFCDIKRVLDAFNAEVYLG